MLGAERLLRVAGVALDRRPVRAGLSVEVAERGDDVLGAIPVRDEADQPLDPLLGAGEAIAPFAELGLEVPRVVAELLGRSSGACRRSTPGSVARAGSPRQTRRSTYSGRR